MTILYHHRTLADGAEGIHIAEMTAAFAALGHQVRLCGLAAGAAGARRARLHWARRRLPAAAVELAAIAANVREAIEVRRLVRATGAGFLYARHARYAVGAIVAARRCGIPVVLEVNALFTGRQYRRFERPVFPRTAAVLERTAVERSTIAVAVSSPLARDVARLRRGRTIVLPNGVDTGQFDPARYPAEPMRARLRLGSAVVAGWTGMLREWHNLELLLAAARAVPGVRLLIVGDGPARPRVEREAAALGLDARVTFAGRVPHAHVPEYLAAMDVAVVADDGTGVASPMKLLEYMAMARAVLAPRLPNIEDLVTDGEDGLLFTPRDGADLAAGLRRLEADPALRARLGRAARETVRSRRTWRANAETVLQLVDELAAPGRAAPRPRPAGPTHQRQGES